MIKGTFIDNHNKPRLLSEQNDKRLYFNALAFVLLSEGIPFIYYGTEQAFSGGSIPYNREALWTSNYDTHAIFYEFITEIISLRKKFKIWDFPFKEIDVNDQFYSFHRGEVFVALTNVGKGKTVEHNIQNMNEYLDGMKICNW